MRSGGPRSASSIPCTVSVAGMAHCLPAHLLWSKGDERQGKYRATIDAQVGLGWCGLAGRAVVVFCVCKTAPLIIFFSFYSLIKPEHHHRKVIISLDRILGTLILLLHLISELFALRQGSALYLYVFS